MRYATIFMIHQYESHWEREMTQQQRLDTIKLHIHLGKKQGLDVSYLIELQQQRYLQSWDIYRWQLTELVEEWRT